VTPLALPLLLAGSAHAQPDASKVSFGRDVHVEAGDRVDEVVAFGGEVRVDGQVDGDAVSFGGDVRVGASGQVHGDAVSFGGQVTVSPGGKIGGERVGMAVPASGLTPPTVQSGHAAATGNLIGMANTELVNELFRRLVMLLSVAGAGVLVIGLFPDRVTRVAHDLRDGPVRAAVVGAAVSVFVLLFSILFVALTLGLGTPLSALLVGGLGLAWLLGFVALCQVVGDRLPLERQPHGRWLAFLVGVVLVSFVGALPWIGWLIVGFASILAVGASVSSRMGADAR